MLKGTLTVLLVLFLFMGLLISQALENMHTDGGLLAILLIIGIDAVAVYYWLKLMEEM